MIKLSTPNSALSQVSFVAGGAIIAQILNVFILPIVSRIYSPEDYGLVAVYSSVIAILSQLSGLCYHQAIPLPKQKRYADALVFLSLIIQIVFVSLLSLLLFICGDLILDYISMKSLVQYKYFIPLGLFFVGAYTVLSQWSVRKGLFFAIGKTKISQCLSGAFIKIGLGFWGLKPIGLLLGSIVSQASGISTLAFAAIKNDGVPSFKIKDLKRVAYRYRRLPMFSSWYGLLNATSGSLPQILLSTFFGFQSAGLYAMATSLLSLPANFIGQAMGQVFLQRASVAKYSGNIAVLSYKSYVLLLKIGFLPIALISLLGPQLFSFFLGERWGGAGLYAIALVPFIAYGFAYSPLSILYTVFDKQKVSLVHEIIYTLGRISGLYIGYLYKNPVISIMVYSIFCFFIQLYRMMYLLNIAGNSRLHVGYMTFKMILQDILLLLFPFLCYVFEVNKYIYIFSIIFIVIIYLHRSYSLLSKEGIL